MRRFGLWLGRAIEAAALLWFATFVALYVYVGTSPTRTTLPAAADAIICLGAGMSYDNEGPVADNASTRRAETCASLYRAELAPVIVFTGAGDETRSAADAMAGIALAAGVPEAAILREQIARSTIQNAAFALALMPDHTDRIIVVSDQFHLPRAGVIFGTLSSAEVVTVPTNPDYARPLGRGDRSDFWWTLREATAIWSNGARAAVYWAGGVVGYAPATRIGWFN